MVWLQWGNIKVYRLTHKLVFGDSHLQLDEMGTWFGGSHIFTIRDGGINTLFHLMNMYYILQPNKRYKKVKKINKQCGY